jgi:outer membrane protein assembly complex protein YaeT
MRCISIDKETEVIFRLIIQRACLTFLLVPLTLPLFTSFALSRTEQTIVRISKVKIKGTKYVSIMEIKEKIGTEFPSLNPFAKRPEFDEEVLKDDMVRIQRLYENHGYYDAVVAYELSYNEKEDMVEITINIKEGKPIILTDLNIDIQGELSEEVRKKIFDSVPLKVKKNFSPIDYQTTKAVISNILSDNGYPKANVEGEALVNRKERWSRVNLKVNPGSLYRFGSIEVEGNKIVTTNIITREATFKKGEIYSAKELSNTQARIFQLELFRSVLIDADFNEGQKVVNLNIRVNERKPGTIKIGAGYGTEDLVRGQILLTQRDFFGGGRRLETSGKFSFLTQRVGTSLIQPYIIGGASDFTGSVNFLRDNPPAFTDESFLGTAGVRKRFARVFNAFGSFNVQFAHLSGVPSPPQDFSEPRGNFFLTFFSSGIERNTTDNILNPTRGTIATFSLESSFKKLGSDLNYLKSTLELRGYKELFNIVFASSITVGVIEPFGKTNTSDIPIFKRFLAGGSTSVRGFPFQKLGPLDANGDPLGGNSLLEGSFEIRFPIYKDFGGVAFFDYGNVYSEQFDYQLNKLKYAPGVGLRYNTLIGPIRADFGYALNPEPGIRRFQFFFSIGQAF